MSIITLENMEFHAYHGCLEHEQQFGNTFLVTLDMEFDTNLAEQSDQLNDTLNYKLVYDEVKKHFQELVFKTVVQRNVKLSEAPSHGLPVILYDADSTGSKNHLALAQEIIKRNSK